jgi:cell division protein FtsZ
VGSDAAKESAEEIRALLRGAHMCFVAAGMGGGTGTGAAPIIARIARDENVLTVGVVTKPFDFEGRRRMITAEKGITELRSEVDTLIIIPKAWGKRELFVGIYFICAVLNVKETSSGQLHGPSYI